MTRASGNQIGEATVRITADTDPLKQGLQDAKQAVSEFNAEVEAANPSEKVSANLVGLVGGIGAAIATAVSSFKAGNKLLDEYLRITGQMTSEDFQNALSGAFDVTKPINEARESLKKLQAEVGYFSLANYKSALGFDSDFDAKMAQIEGVAKRIRKLREKDTKDDTTEQIARDIEKERIAVLEGAERIEAQRAAAIAAARKKYADNADTLISYIDKRYDKELARFHELEQRKAEAAEKERQREREAIEDRERRERAALERLARQQQEIADKTAAAIASAFSKARQDFASALSMKDLVVGIQALNANLDNMRRNRQQIASGDLASF